MRPSSHVGPSGGPPQRSRALLRVPGGWRTGFAWRGERAQASACDDARTPDIHCVPWPQRRCAIRAKWPPPMRSAMRAAITSIPPHQWVCDDGLVAFFTIIATRSRSSERPRYHQGDRS
jgi:hypothetical protein